MSTGLGQVVSLITIPTKRKAFSTFGNMWIDRDLGGAPMSLRRSFQKSEYRRPILPSYIIFPSFQLISSWDDLYPISILA